MTSEFETNWMPAVAGFLLGAALGALHLTLLWMSVRRLLYSTRPGSWLLATGVIRIVAVGSALVWAVAGNWPRGAACLAGFIAIRWLGVSRLRIAASQASGRNEHAH